jgi:hypothetical protein
MRLLGGLMQLAVVTTLGLMLAGCSTTKTVSVVTEEGPGTWTTGQHDYCIYKANRLICTPQGNRPLVLPDEMKGKIKPGEKVKIEDVMFLNSVRFMSQVEDSLQSGKPKLQVTVFDTKFSEKPEDYSVWNCISTGQGSPAVECKVMKQPNTEDKEYVARELKKQQEVKDATLKMSLLTHKLLEERCGQPVQRGEDSISVTELYKGQSELLAFHFSTYPPPEDKLTIASSLDAPPAKLNHDAVLSGKHHWWGVGGLESESPWYLQQLACLNK